MNYYIIEVNDNLIVVSRKEYNDVYYGKVILRRYFRKSSAESFLNNTHINNENTEFTKSELINYKGFDIDELKNTTLFTILSFVLLPLNLSLIYNTHCTYEMINYFVFLLVVLYFVFKYGEKTVNNFCNLIKHQYKVAKRKNHNLYKIMKINEYYDVNHRLCSVGNKMDMEINKSFKISDYIKYYTFLLPIIILYCSITIMLFISYSEIYFDKDCWYLSLNGVVFTVALITSIFNIVKIVNIIRALYYSEKVVNFKNKVVKIFKIIFSGNCSCSK